MPRKKLIDVPIPPVIEKRGRGRPIKPITLDPKQSLSPDRIYEAKIKILSLLEEGKAYTLTAAAKLLGMSTARVQAWRRTDKDFDVAIKDAEKVFGEVLVNELGQSNNVLAKIFIVKKIFPEYRDNYHVEQRNQKLEELLHELKKLKSPAPEPKVAEVEKPALPQGTIEGEVNITELPPDIAEITKQV